MEDPTIDNQMKADLGQHDLTAIPGGRKDTWFIKRLGDGFIFACDEKEAGEIMYNRGNWMRRDFRIIGTSDGSTYNKVIAESRNEAIKVDAEIRELESALSKYRKLEEKMIMEDLVDPNDIDPSTLADREKLKKLQGIIDTYLHKIDEANTRYKKLTKEVGTTAFNAELEIAKLTPRRPRNLNMITPGASEDERNKIMGKMF